MFHEFIYEVGCTKVPDEVTLQEKWLFGCLWLRYRIRTHNKPSQVGQLLGLFPCIILFGLYQSSSSNLHYKLKSTKSRRTYVLTKQDFSSSITECWHNKGVKLPKSLAWAPAVFCASKPSQCKPLSLV